jgi:hypothetical protein
MSRSTVARDLAIRQPAPNGSEWIGARPAGSHRRAGSEKPRSRSLLSKCGSVSDILRMAGIAQVTILMMPVAPVSTAADEIVLPSGSLDRTQPIELTYRMSEAATGEGIIELTWTISLSAGRAVIYKRAHDQRYQHLGSIDRCRRTPRPRAKRRSRDEEYRCSLRSASAASSLNSLGYVAPSYQHRAHPEASQRWGSR